MRCARPFSVCVFFARAGECSVSLGCSRIWLGLPVSHCGRYRCASWKDCLFSSFTTAPTWCRRGWLALRSLFSTANEPAFVYIRRAFYKASMTKHTRTHSSSSTKALRKKGTFRKKGITHRARRTSKKQRFSFFCPANGIDILPSGERLFEATATTTNARTAHRIVHRRFKCSRGSTLAGVRSAAQQAANKRRYESVSI